MPEVYATKNLGEIEMSGSGNTITVTSSALTNYRLSESEKSTSLTIDAGELRFERIGANGTWAVCGRGTMTASTIEIPSKYAGDDVTEIYATAFINDMGLEGITIPTSIQNIGRQAFEGCTALSRVTFVDTAHVVIFFKKPGSWATPYVYYKYGNATNNDGLGTMMDLVDASESLYSCAVPINTTEIRFRSEDEQYTTTSYKIEDVNLSYALFKTTEEYGVYILSLTHYNPGEDFINYGGLKIANYAFKNCTSLATLNLPQRLTSIDYDAFCGCTSLTSLSCPEHSRLIKIGDSAFYNCTELTTVDIKDGLRQIAKNAFLNCSKLYQLNLGNQLEEIGANAFNGCDALIDLTIPASVKLIGTNAFKWNKSPVGNTYITFENPYTWVTSSSRRIEPESVHDSTWSGKVWRPEELYSENPKEDWNAKYNSDRLRGEYASYYWHRLDRMIPPKVSLSNNTLTMIDPLKIAEDFRIYVNGSLRCVVLPEKQES